MLPSESSLPIARRATWRDTECLELVCGIANAGGGRLILDADVDSRGAVKRRTSRLMKTIPGLIGQSLNLTCAVELVLDSGRFCLEVVIPPANDPISFRGIFFFYKDGENHILDDEALDRLMQRDMEADVKWEQRPVVQASLDDLNMGLVTRFTGAARDTDLTVDLDEVSAIEQTLRHAGLMTGVGTPTNAGILLLHNRPHQYIPGATVRIGFLEVTAARPSTRTRSSVPSLSKCTQPSSCSLRSICRKRSRPRAAPTVSAPPAAMVDRLGMRCTKPCSTRSPIRTTTAVPPCR